MICDGEESFMEIILLIVLFILMCSLDVKKQNFDEFERDMVRNKHFQRSKSYMSNYENFEEVDSVFDSCGNEHLLDEDGYCEECDDYHDWD